MLYLNEQHAADSKVRIIPELGVRHGDCRVDIAVVNGVMHGYEIKSDLDTLNRLPEQVRAFNDVFDQMTLVVGKRHLLDALREIPEWWDVWMAKPNMDGSSVELHVIRQGGFNPRPNSVSVARLLWREEAIRILEDVGEARGLYSKSRECLYEKLASLFDHQTLSRKVRETLFFRDWRADAPLMQGGD